MDCVNPQTGCVKNNVLIGKKSQLFLFEGNYNQFSFLTGNEKITEHSKRNFLSNLQLRSSFAERLNIPYLHVVIPCKPLVLRNQCPDPYRSSIRSLFLNAYAPMFRGSNPIEEKVLYPLADLIRAQVHQDCYWANDTHINAAGQLCLYRAIGQRIPDLSSDFPLFRIAVQPRLGDLSLMLGELEPLPSLCFPWIGEILQYRNTEQLKGNTGDVVITYNPLSRTERRLALFGDSFIKTMTHLFAQDFQTVIYIRGPYFQADMIELFKPDVLITSETERYLAGVDSDENGRSMLHSSVTETADYQPAPDFQQALSAQLSQRSLPWVTAQWAKEQENKHLFRINGIGSAIHNRDIKQINNSQNEFVAVGPTPVIHIYQLEQQPHSNLQIMIDSDVDSQFEITVLRQCEQMNTPLETQRFPIHAGNQIINVPVDTSRALEGLLIQPLDKRGHFSIVAEWKEAISSI